MPAFRRMAVTGQQRPLAFQQVHREESNSRPPFMPLGYKIPSIIRHNPPKNQSMKITTMQFRGDGVGRIRSAATIHQTNPKTIATGQDIVVERQSMVDCLSANHLTPRHKIDPPYGRDDMDHFLAFRYKGMSSMIGYRQRNVFYVLWFDHDFTLYDH